MAVEPEESVSLLSDVSPTEEEEKEAALDPEAMPPPEEAKPEPPPATTAKTGPSRANGGPPQSQMTMFNQHCKRLRLTQAKQETLLKAQIGQGTFADLTREEATAVIKFLQQQNAQG
jgi:hypothetical protein